MTARGPLVVVHLPGASLMRLRQAGDALEVECPGCGAVQRFGAAVGATARAAFEHEDGCRVHRQIQAAIERYERDVVRHD